MAKRKPQTEKTAKGFKVPVPKRRDFFSNLKKIARPRSATGSPKK